MPSFLGHPRTTAGSVQSEYATWNPAGTNSNITLTSGNLTAEVTGPAPSTAYGSSATTGYSFDNGKRYVEIELDNIAGSSSGIAVGFTDSDQTPGFELGDLTYAYAWRADGYKESNGVAVALGSSAVSGTIIRLAIHAYVESGIARANIWFGINENWFDGGDPVLGVNPAFSGAVAPLATDWAIRATMKATGDRIIANFGATPFIYSVPSGFGRGWGKNI